MSIFERFGFTAAAAGRGSRPLIPKKVRTLFSAATGTSVSSDGANPSDGQASRPPMVAASFDAGDRQA